MPKLSLAEQSRSVMLMTNVFIDNISTSLDDQSLLFIHPQHLFHHDRKEKTNRFF